MLRTITTYIVVFFAGSVIGFFYSQSDIDNGKIKEKRVISHNTEWIKKPPHQGPLEIKLPDYIYDNYAFYKESYSAPITINHKLDNNWMYVNATDGYKSAKKEIELFSTYSHNWKITLGVSAFTFIVGAYAYHKFKK